MAERPPKKGWSFKGNKKNRNDLSNTTTPPAPINQAEESSSTECTIGTENLSGKHENR